jgi:hypothetical protein
MPNADKTAIVLVLDKSGSMGTVQDATISGFNEFVDEQKKVAGEVLFSLTLFDTDLEKRALNKALAEIPALNRETYVPGGMTALYDAVGHTIHDVGRHLDGLAEDDKPDRVLFVIQTDGQENSSREYTADRVRQMIREQRDRWAWEFMFLGADQDAWVAGGNLGIAAGQTLSYGNDAIGTRAAFASVSNVATSYRTTGDSVDHSLKTTTGNDLRKRKPATK